MNWKINLFAVAAFCLLLCPATVRGGLAIGHRIKTPADTLAKQVFVRAIPSKARPYVGEPFTVSYLLYHQLPIIDPQDELPVKLQDCFVEEFPVSAESYEEVLAGKKFHVLVLRKLLVIPQREGLLRLPSVRRTVKLTVPPAPDDFFGMEQIVSRELVSEAVPMDIRPLPAPADTGMFSRAVGSFSFRSKPRVAAAANMLTYQLELTGYGNLKNTGLHVPELPEGLELFNQNSSIEEKLTGKGLLATRTFTFDVVASYRGNYTLPALMVVAFNPASEKYETYQADAFEWKVTAGPEAPKLLATAANKNDTATPLLLKLKPGSSKGRLLWQKPVFYILLLLCSFFIIGGMLYSRYTQAQSAAPAHRLSRKAGKRALRAFKQLKRTSGQINSDAFYQKAEAILKQYFLQKLQLQQEALPPALIIAALRERQVPGHVLAEVQALLKEIDAIRFAPTQQPVADREAFRVQAMQVIQHIDKFLNGKHTPDPVAASSAEHCSTRPAGTITI
ncbi:BatD family protein [Pontibacter sp. SGAir0037]|uniref:BatD family protein n=1 Tax=Pontibacter sp. SGAir0037 TaxID=2571030 RepID=UPI0010CCE0C2|nr:BatD family protein [Pontibacter sp. SGAir0037]QCR21568.1 hypothetical protein C1N53_03865 [Pontibacter sp. SGAir0037]